MSRTEPSHGEGRRARASRLVAIAATCALLGAVAGLVVALLQDERHEAAASVLLAAPDAGADVVSGSPAAGDAGLEHRTSAALLDSDPVRRRALARLVATRVGDPAGRVDEVETEVRDRSSLAVITASAPAHPLAAQVADEYARAYLDVRRATVRSRLSDLATALEERAALLARQDGADAASLARTRRRAAQLRALSAVEPADAQLLQTASPVGPAEDAPLLAYGLAGAGIGLLAGLLLGLLLRRDTSRVASERQAEEVLGAPLLASVPRTAALAGEQTMPGALAPRDAEAFRMLRANLAYLDREHEQRVRSLLVTSSRPGEGKSTVAFNLAALAAAAGRDVLLIEADLRRPAVSRRLGLPTADGLAELLLDDGELADAVRELPAPAGGPETGTLDVLSAGLAGAHAGELLDSARMRSLLAEAEDRYDLVVIDAPPPSVVSDAIPLLDQVGAVVVVAGIGRVTVDEMRRLRDTLRRTDAPLAGVVANFVAPRRDAEYDRYLTGRDAASTAAHDGRGRQVTTR